MRLLFIACCVVLVLNVRTEAADAIIADEFSRKFETRERPKLNVRNPDGFVSLTAVEGTTVEIQVVKEVRRARNLEEAKKEADKVRVEIREFEPRIEISVEHPKRVFSVGGHPHVIVSLQIKAPRESDIDASVSDGDLTAQGFTGRIDLSVADGNLEARSCSGDVQLKAADGNIRAQDLSGTLHFQIADGDLHANNCTGSMRIRSADGTVRMEALQGEVEASNADGEMILQGVLNSFYGKVADGNMEVQIASGSIMKNDWSLQSADGNILLELPQDFSANFQISASDGSIHTDLPIEVTGSLNNRRWNGKLKDGGHTIQIKTADGDIRLR